MASRLSEEQMRKIYDGGYQSLAWDLESVVQAGLSKVDLDSLIKKNNAPERIKALPPQELYVAIKEKGPEDCLEVLEHISQEQLVTIVDYEAWSNDKLEAKQAFKWLNLFKEISREQFFERYTELDEEYQISLLAKYVKVYEQEVVEKFSDIERDKLFTIAEGQLYLSIESEDKEVVAFITDLIDIFLGENPNYCLALLAHAAYLPPNEQEETVRRFRNARLEEDGYVGYEESLLAFQPLEPSVLREKYSSLGQLPSEGAGALIISQQPEKPFFDIVQDALNKKVPFGKLDQLKNGYLYLANSLCSACQIEADDLSGLKMLLEQSQALSGLGLEYLSDGHIPSACEIIQKEHPKVVFRTGLSLVYDLRKQIFEQLQVMQLPEFERIRRAYYTSKFGELLMLIDQHWTTILGFEYCETLKGLFNRFPMVASGKQFDEENNQVIRVVFKAVSSMARLKQLEKQCEVIHAKH